MRKVVGENEGLAHAFDGKQSILGIVLSICKEDFSGDPGAEGSDEMEDIVLSRKVRTKRRRVQRRVNYEG